MASTWLNGSMTPEQSASLSIRDTGLLHGAGVFTTMRAYKGKVFRVAQHLKRIRKSCGALSIPLQYSDAELEDAIGQVIADNVLEDARLRLTVTRGSATGSAM